MTTGIPERRARPFRGTVVLTGLGRPLCTRLAGALERRGYRTLTPRTPMEAAMLIRLVRAPLVVAGPDVTEQEHQALREALEASGQRRAGRRTDEGSGRAS